MTEARDSDVHRLCQPGPPGQIRAGSPDPEFNPPYRESLVERAGAYHVRIGDSGARFRAVGENSTFRVGPGETLLDIAK